MANVKITINGNEVEAEQGRWLIDVLNDNACDIPHFCYHPGLGPDGNCRMCQVEYVSERGNRLAISCNQPVVEGLNIVTDSERVKNARAGVEEALLLNHPLDCPICDKAGECTLQNYYMAHDLGNTKQQFPRFKKRKALDIGPTMVLDQERCVLCDRCVRFLRDWAEEEQLYIAGRGHESFLTPFPGKEVDSAYSLNTVDLCPVGALTSKDFRFHTPTWMLKRTPSTCTTCARGCAIEVDVDTRDNTVRRLRPRFNPDVNGHWICDEGRLNYKFVNTNRIRDGYVTHGERKIDTTVDVVLGEIASVVGDAKSSGAAVQILASATCTLEEMFALKKLAVAADAKLEVATHVPDGEADNKLRVADRHPNVKGAELLGIPVIDLRGEGSGNGKAAEGGSVMIAVGFDYEVGPAVINRCAGHGKVVSVSARQTALSEMAHFIAPGLTFAEKDGLVVNVEGHVQQLAPAMDNLWDRTPTWQVLSKLTGALSEGAEFGSISDLRSAMMNEESAFTAVNMNAVGPTGARTQAHTL